MHERRWWESGSTFGIEDDGRRRGLEQLFEVNEAQAGVRLHPVRPCRLSVVLIVDRMPSEPSYMKMYVKPTLRLLSFNTHKLEHHTRFTVWIDKGHPVG